MTVRKRSKVWWYDFGNHKYRGPIPEARTKHEAEQAEVKLKRDVFEGKYGKQFGTMLFAEFVGNQFPVFHSITSIFIMGCTSQAVERQG